MYFKRTIEKTIEKLARFFPCLVIYGPRQVGKSTTVNELFNRSIPHVTLDDIDDRSLANSNPKLFLDNYSYPLVIDEIQKAPILLDEIKRRIDLKKQQWLKEEKPYELMYILTGSNSFEIQNSIADSLAGRIGILSMSSFDQKEKDQEEENPFENDFSKLKEKKNRVRSKKEIFESIFEGGMPEIVTRRGERDFYFKSYLNSYIEKDVRKLVSASNELSFRNFIYYLALRTGQEFHPDDIGKDLGIDGRTIKRWTSILETSGIIYLLQPFMSRASNRIIKAPKLYFMDTGLCAYLCKWPTSEMLQNCAMSGAFFETYVVSEILKNFLNFNKRPEDSLFYYRDKDRKEVDLILAQPDGITPIEIKKGVSPSSPTKNFDVLKKYNQTIKLGMVIDTCDKLRLINDKAFMMPVGLIGV